MPERMTRPPACRMRNVRGGDRTRPQRGGCHKACDWRADRRCGAYGVRQHAPGRGAGGAVLKLAGLVLIVVGVWERAARVWNTAGIVMKFLSARLLLFDEHLLTCHGV